MGNQWLKQQNSNVKGSMLSLRRWKGDSSKETQKWHLFLPPQYRKRQRIWMCLRVDVVLEVCLNRDYPFPTPKTKSLSLFCLLFNKRLKKLLWWMKKQMILYLRKMVQKIMINIFWVYHRLKIYPTEVEIRRDKNDYLSLKRETLGQLMVGETLNNK